MGDLLSVSEARTRVFAAVRPLASEQVAVEDASDRVLAAPALAATDLPPFASSAMDGFAVRAADLPGVLPVVFRVAAGRPAPQALPESAAMGVATGGVIPLGADAVVPVERAVDLGDRVRIDEAPAAGANVRRPGGDVRLGEVVLEAGVRVGPGQVGAVAAAGLATLTCGARPRVVVVTTGTELRAPGQPLRPGEIYESNGVMLEALLRRYGAEVERTSPVHDDPAALHGVLRDALDADVLVTSGGVSVGPHDLVRQTLGDLGVTEDFWGVAMRPGKPMAFGSRAGTLVFGLPGNPVSAMVGAVLFVGPAILALQGAADPGPVFERGILGSPVVRNPARDEYARARLGSDATGTVVHPLAGQESHMIVHAAGAEALAVVERGEGGLSAGDPVPYLRLP